MSNDLRIDVSLPARFSRNYNLPEDVVEKILPPLMRAHNITWKERDVSVRPEDEATLEYLFMNKVNHGRGALPRAEEPPPTMAVALLNKLSGKHKELQDVEGDSLANYLYTLAIEVQEDQRDVFREEYLRTLSEVSHENTVIQRCCAYPLLSILPFMKPDVGNLVEFNQITYSVTRRFDLRTIGGSTPAYLLEADGQSPILVFKGSTFPGDEGYAAGWLSDFTPGVSVGHIPARSNELKEWFDSQDQVTVVGASLGGSLALQMVSLYGDKLKEVHAFNPAGLHLFKEYKGNAPVYIYSQWNDLVSTMGYFPEWATIYRIIPDAPHPTTAHSHVYAGQENVTIIQTPASYENRRPERHALSTLHITGAIVPFTLLSIGTTTYNTYDLLTRQSIGKKKKISCFDRVAVIMQIALGALLLSFAIYIWKHRQLPIVQKIIHKMGNKRFEQATIALAVIGGLLTLGGLRAVGHLTKKRPIAELGRVTN